ncbi:unnamed protein product [Pleuronectes platessa]|uniref:Uncharacterized protein n=1 Tax=Pleuronectes platessa TaxID=8262 RepID=A0A9N7VLI4_PLEPL|nr:unnamed protein product [Pleuronectes platessa]
MSVFRERALASFYSLVSGTGESVHATRRQTRIPEPINTPKENRRQTVFFAHASFHPASPFVRSVDGSRAKVLSETAASGCEPPPPRKHLICSGCPELFELDHPRNFPALPFCESIYSAHNVRVPRGRDHLDADGSSRSVSPPRDTTRQSHQPMRGRVRERGEDALPRAGATSSLLAPSCLLSSSPDAPVRVCLGPCDKEAL